jgi:hypothetical protein
MNASFLPPEALLPPPPLPTPPSPSPPPLHSPSTRPGQPRALRPSLRGPPARFAPGQISQLRDLARVVISQKMRLQQKFDCPTSSAELRLLDDLSPQ